MCEVVKDQKGLQVSQAWRLRPASGYLESLSSVLLGTVFSVFLHQQNKFCCFTLLTEHVV